MPDTLPNIRIIKDVPLDLYSASSITVGNKISVMNCGKSVVRLHTKASTPVSGDGYWPLYPGDVLTNTVGDSGAWATSPLSDNSINVKEVS